MPDPSAVAVQFNECINAGDLRGLADLMTEDHQFVDTEGTVVSGRDACVEAWRGFFAAFPGYRNVFTDMATDETTVTISGYSESAEPALAGPARWTARIAGDRVAEWRVDNP